MIPPMSEPDILGNTASNSIAAMDELTDARAKLAAVRALCDGAIERFAREWAGSSNDDRRDIFLQSDSAKDVAYKKVLAILDAPSAEQFPSLLDDWNSPEDAVYDAAKPDANAIEGEGYRRGYAAGFAHGERADTPDPLAGAAAEGNDPLSVDCETCSTTGRIVGGIFPELCPVCGGTGFIAAARKDTS